MMHLLEACCIYLKRNILHLFEIKYTASARNEISCICLENKYFASI